MIESSDSGMPDRFFRLPKTEIYFNLFSKTVNFPSVVTTFCLVVVHFLQIHVHGLLHYIFWNKNVRKLKGFVFYFSLRIS